MAPAPEVHLQNLSDDVVTSLIQPHIGARVVRNGGMPCLSELIRQALALAPERIDQSEAPPLDTRVILDL